MKTQRMFIKKKAPQLLTSVLNRVGPGAGVSAGAGPGVGRQNWMTFGTHTQHTLLGMHTKFHPILSKIR